MNLDFFDRIRQRTQYAYRVMTGDSPIGSGDLSEFMVDQLGHGWQDRLQIMNEDLSPTKVSNIINNASSRTYGNLGALYELMYKVTLDSRIGGMVDKRTEAVTKAMWDISTGNKDNATANEAAEFIQKWFESIKFKEVLQKAMDGKLFGVTAFQNAIFRDGDKYIFDDLAKHQISQSRWRQGISDSDDEYGRLYIKTKSGGIGSFTDDQNRIFIDDENDIHPMRLSTFIYKEKRGYWDTTGIMARVLRLYILKIYMLKFWAQLAERNGKPFVYALLEDSNFKDPEFKGKMKSLLKQFGAERWGIFPRNLDIESLDTSSPTASNVYLDLLNFANVELAIALLGQNLSTEVQGGSFAAASSHADVEEGKIEGDVEWLEESLNDCTIYWLTKINYPNLDEDEYPTLSLTPKKAINVEQEARGLKAVSELVDVPVDEIYARTQVRPPRMKEGEEGEEQLTGSDRYDEEVVGPSTRRTSRLDQIIRTT